MIDGFIYIFIRQPAVPDPSLAIEVLPCHSIFSVEIEPFSSSGDPANVCVLNFSGARMPMVMAVEARDDKLDEIKVRCSKP